MGNCAAGFGVCCIFSVSVTGSIVNQNCSYITNPGYPSSYIPTTTPMTVSYTINKCSSDICRVRLDYDQFVLSPPVTTAADATPAVVGGPDVATDIAIDGQCQTDIMTITTTALTTVPITAPTGTPASIGNYPYFCGTNTGYHSYIDLSCDTADSAALTFKIGDLTNNQWKIKVTQLSCESEDVASTEGCFQYYTGLTGVVQSYNYAGNNNHMAATNYKVCIRPEAGYCCIAWSVEESFEVDLAGETTANLATNVCTGGGTQGMAGHCTTAMTCSLDYVVIPGGSTGPTDTTTFDRFCGQSLHYDGFSIPAANVPIVSCKCPFQLGVFFSKTSNNGVAADIHADRGFSLRYTQIAGSC